MGIQKKRPTLLVLIAGICWIVAIVGPFIIVQLESQRIFNFWDFGGPGAVVCAIVWFILGAFIAREVSGMAVKKGSSLGGIAISAFAVLTVGAIIASTAIAVAWHK